MSDRDKHLTIRTSAYELQMAKDLAENDGLNVSDWLRLTIRQKHAEAFPATKLAPKDSNG